MPYANDNSSMPRVVCWLGVAGVLPFFALAILPHTPVAPKIPESALLAYGAVILSFLGGVLWGMSLNGNDTTNGAPRRLIIGVIASLVGWGALLLPLTAGLLTLAASFLALLAVDYILYRSSYIPPWYLRLRISLTLIVSATLMIAALV